MVTVKWCEYCGIKSCVRTVHVLHWRGLEKVVGDVAQARGKVRVRSELILGRWISGWASNHWGNARTREQVLKPATCDKCQRKSNYSNVYAPTILPNSKSTVLPVVVIVSLQQVCIQSLFLMSASAPWGDSTLWSLMADKAQQTENKLR